MQTHTYTHILNQSSLPLLQVLFAFQYAGISVSVMMIMPILEDD